MTSNPFSLSIKILLYVVICSRNIESLSTKSTVDTSKIRAISLDVTGTLLATKEPVVKSYRDAAIWARLPTVPTKDDFKKGFGVAFRKRCIESPCFGGVEGISGREWWFQTVQRVLDEALEEERGYTEEDFERYFRRVYQHFGSPAGYMILDDANSFLTSISSSSLILGITSNTPTRHMESVLPMLNIHDKFNWFTCSQSVGAEKPSPQIFDDAFRQAKFWLPDLEKDSILHIGDSYTNDYCGAKAYGFQALLLDRSDNPAVTQYQDWLEAPDYPGKSGDDLEANTITNLEEVASLLL